MLKPRAICLAARTAFRQIKIFNLTQATRKFQTNSVLNCCLPTPQALFCKKYGDVSYVQRADRRDLVDVIFLRTNQRCFSSRFRLVNLGTGTAFDNRQVLSKPKLGDDQSTEKLLVSDLQSNGRSLSTDARIFWIRPVMQPSREHRQAAETLPHWRGRIGDCHYRALRHREEPRGKILSRVHLRLAEIAS